MAKIAYFISTVVLCLLLTGCSGPGLVDVSRALPAKIEDLQGVWTGDVRGDAYQFPGMLTVRIGPDGTGTIWEASIMKDGTQSWLRKWSFTLQQESDGRWTLHYDPAGTITLEGSHSVSTQFRRARNPIYLTANGLALDMYWWRDRYLRKVESTPPAEAEVEARAAMALAQMRSRYWGGGMPAMAPANDGHLHLVSGMTQFGMGIAAANRGNYAAAQQSFMNAQAAAQAGLEGRPFDPMAAMQQSMQAGYALAGGPQPTGGGTFAQTAGTPPRRAAPAQGLNFVTITPAEMAMYTDGHVYDILTLLPPPGGKSAGEFCFVFGLSLAEARTLLANGHAMAGDRSSTNPGINPRRMVSYRKKPVAVGDTIQMGASFQSTLSGKPAGYIAYDDNPL